MMGQGLKLRDNDDVAKDRAEKQEAPLSAEDQGQRMQSAGNILHFCPFVSKHGLGMGIYRYPPVTTIRGGQPRKLRSEAEECIRH